MDYVTSQQLIDRFGEVELIQLTDNGQGQGTINNDTVYAAIQDSNNEIEFYLRQRYPLPLLFVPVELNRIAADIARFYLYVDQVTPLVDLRYTNAIALLKRISTGLASLPPDCVDTSSNGGTASGGMKVIAHASALGSFNGVSL